MPRSPSLSPPLSPPPPASAGPSTVPASPQPKKPLSDAEDDIQLIEHGNGAAHGSASPSAQAEQSQARAAEARKRHQADLAQHAYEAPKADRPQDDWQVAYVWAFIVKFNLKDRIKRLECLEDFERSLVEPVANRPDDILEGILIRFLSNLRPGLRNLDCTNVQHHLSNYISDQLLNTSEFTVWDRAWAPNEEARGLCCNSEPGRTELGRLRYAGEPPSERVDRNPLRQMEKKGGGLFELYWRERASLLRQLVDWQLTDCDPIRAIINKENHTTLPKGATISESQGKVGIESVGMDRNKQRIWMLDNSGRLYRSGNPFKRPCPIYAISSNKTEMQSQIDSWAEYGNSGRPKAKRSTADKKLAKGIEDEKRLAEVVGGMMEAVEKEDARIARARKRIADAAKFVEQAEFRSTRTRRTTKKIDYSYGDDPMEDDGEYQYEEPRRGRRDPAPIVDSRRPVLPGERKSARLTVKDQDDASESYIDDMASSNGAGRESRQATPANGGDEKLDDGKMTNGSAGDDVAKPDKAESLGAGTGMASEAVSVGAAIGVEG